MRSGRGLLLGRLRYQPLSCVGSALPGNCHNCGCPEGPSYPHRAGHPSSILKRLPVLLVAPIPVGGTCLFWRVDRACRIAADTHRHRY
jgi:hypothetical protein